MGEEVVVEVDDLTFGTVIGFQGQCDNLLLTELLFDVIQQSPVA